MAIYFRSFKKINDETKSDYLFNHIHHRSITLLFDMQHDFQTHKLSEMNNSYTQHIKQRQQTVKQQVMQLLGWDELRYAEMQYRAGRQYLQSYIPNDPEGIDALERSRIFWAWWKNQWLIRDTAYLSPAIAKVSRTSALRIYEYMHDPESLAHAIYPNGVVLDESYAKMIDEFNKEEVANG